MCCSDLKSFTNFQKHHQFDEVTNIIINITDFRRITWSEPEPLWTPKNSLWRTDSEFRKKECFDLQIGNHELNRFEIRNLGPDYETNGLRPWLKICWKWPSEKKPFRWLWVIEALFLNQALILVSIFSTKITYVSSYQISLKLTFRLFQTPLKRKLRKWFQIHIS